ncbi:PREDICTED: nostrin-like isoform X1 [Branchiostoma belcheri]|uniref:Nostrin-like isoform X1 n=1 Tax=Branchiostoma belcheri TaxID=7741 RepID=A0A6P4ZYX6_BRABE|nr:PREDICTED: nostrin-like isoform X1 [Branchiostoma belcheri]
MPQFKDAFMGHFGYDELKRHMRQAKEFCNEIGAVLHERAELEQAYAKGLSKLSTKLAKAVNTTGGTLMTTWTCVATEMELEAEMHRNLSSALNEDAWKPLKSFIEAQSKTRKPMETTVEKVTKSLGERIAEQNKMKVTTYLHAREMERLQEQLDDVNSGKGRVFSEKEISKLHKKKKKAEDNQQKSETEYLDLVVKAERSRHDWEASAYKCCALMQNLEEERIKFMHELLNKYNSFLSDIGPKMAQSCNRLGESVLCVDISGDIAHMIEHYKTVDYVPEQLLYDCYEEDTTNTINTDRRKSALLRKLHRLGTEIDREKKSREGTTCNHAPPKRKLFFAFFRGVQHLHQVYSDRPGFADSEAKGEVHQQLLHLNAMIDLLSVSQYKLQCTLALLEGHNKPEHPLSQYIEQHRDKQYVGTANVHLKRLRRHSTGSMLLRSDSVLFQGIMHSTLRIPTVITLGATGGPPQSSGPAHRHATLMPQGNSVPMRSEPTRMETNSVDSTYDGYSDTEFDDGPPEVLCQCKAQFAFTSNEKDEISIQPGDIINVHEKLEDGWWCGELRGHTGYFPASYVEELPTRHASSSEV